MISSPRVTGHEPKAEPTHTLTYTKRKRKMKRKRKRKKELVSDVISGKL